MAKVDTSGSWFNSGYHGHYRSKSRSDFICEYRHLSKPSPPKKYLKRSSLKATDHSFSKHDNRQAFLNDALIFQEGLGRRRIPNATYGWKPELLEWVPTKDDLRKAGPKGKLSTYTYDFRGVPSQPVEQKIIRRPKTSFDDRYGETTTYRYSFGGSNPNQRQLNAMTNDGLTPRNKKQTGSFISGRESVASCLTWHVPKVKRNAPAATQMSVPTMQTTTTQPCITQTAPAAMMSTPAETSAPAATMAPHPPSAPKPVVMAAV